MGHDKAIAMSANQPSAPQPASDLAAVEAAIDLLLDGRYLQVSGGDTPLGRKLARLAEHLHDHARRELGCLVDMSCNTNEAVTATADMTRAVREVDRRTQAIAAAADEMVASVQEISRNSDEVAAEAEQARAAADTAMQATDQAVKAMQAISAAVEEAAGQVESLAEASSQIGEIVQQIEGIAKQTNLLALNATIEAARAGEAGKGFAVVAGEVKNLANQTARATEDIRGRIERLRNGMGAIVSSMEDGAEAVESGRGVIEATGAGMRDVVGRIGTVTAKMHEVAEILGQQNLASAEISQGIAGIAEMASANVNGISAILDVMDRTDKLVGECIGNLASLEIRDFTVMVAKSDHMIWRKRLAEMVAGRTRLNPAELSDHHSCRLGKWYDAVKDPALREHPAFARLADPHREVHAHGIEAARRYNDGDLDGALACIGLAAKASEGVMACLDDLSARGGGAAQSSQ